MRETVDKIKSFLNGTKKFEFPDRAFHMPSLITAPEMASVICEVERGLVKGIEPERSKDSTTPVYFLKNCEGESIAVFKAFRYSKLEMLREIAAFQLDYESFAGVPPTVITTLTHATFGGTKQGALQLYIEDASPLIKLENNDYKTFSAAQVRRIATLDIRLLNHDRHFSNLIFTGNRLYPIDHGISLPTKSRGLSFAWIDWPQAKTEFSEKEKSYLLNLDADADRRMLLSLGIEEESANLSFFATQLLKMGVKKGLTAFHIASLLKGKRKQGGLCSPFQEAISKIKVEATKNWEEISKQANEVLERLIQYEIS